ncbi:MAG: hypothetical protein GVY15_12435 [Bacteroidetes bacterium]|jgi:hypothetical protein|nr:hypothetical protein [Bacteroidota bacterium]
MLWLLCVMTLIAHPAPSAQAQESSFSLGLEAQLSASQPGVQHLGDLTVGPTLRHRLAGPLHGQVGARVGMISGTGYRARTLPVEYRLHLALASQSRVGAHLFAGGGLRWHRMTEVTPPPSPVLAPTDEPLRAGPTWSLDAGRAAYIPLGAGLTLRLDDRVRMDLQVHYHWTPAGATLSGQPLTHDRWGLTVGMRLHPGTAAVPPPAPRPQGGAAPAAQPQAPRPVSAAVSATFAPQTVAAPDRPALAVSLRQPVPLPLHVRSDTLTAGACQYAVQVGTYSSADRALQVAQETTDRTGASFQLVPNRANDLYAVRTIPQQVASEASRQLLTLRQQAQLKDGMALIEQCAAPQERPAPVPLQVELWAFAERGAADARAAQLREALATEVVVRNVGGRVPYRVYSGPFTNTAALDAHLQAVRADDASADPATRVAPHRARHALAFDYRLQTGQFRMQDDALRHARRLDARHGYPAHLSTDERGHQVVHLDVPFRSWQAFLDVKRTIDASMTGPASIPVLRETTAGSAEANR